MVENNDPKPGDYVTARLIGQAKACQGVFLRVDSDGNALVLGQMESKPYLCDPEIMATVPDHNIFLPDTIKHIQHQRKLLGLPLGFDDEKC